MKLLINAINDNAQPRGPDRYLDELLRHMLAETADLSVELCLAPWQKMFMEADYGPQLRKHILAPPRKPLKRAIWQALSFPRIANRLGADIVFLPNLLWTPGLAAPSVIVAHDLLQFRAPDKFGTFKAGALRRLIRWGLARADHVISVSEFTAQDLNRFTDVPDDKITVILEGGPEPRSNKADRGMAFLYVGKIERTKNVDLIIEAFTTSKALSAAKAQLIITGPEGNASADIAAHLDHPNITRTGFVTEDELEQLYATCRGFVFPSSAEGFGLVLLEAMARGAPVIAADATSLPEVLGDAGILVPDKDLSALREAMERLAQSDTLCDNLRAKGYARLNTFSWKTAASETLAVFRALSAQKDAQP